MKSHIEQHVTSYKEKYKNRGRLLISCSDQPGIVSAVSTFLFEQGANIVESSQHSTNPEGGTFFIRFEFECDRLDEKGSAMEEAFQSIAESFSMEAKFTYAHRLKRTAVFVSKELHCLLELLWAWESGDLMSDIAVVVSNHEDAREVVESFGIPFYHIPATKEIRAEAEAQQLQLLKDYNIDLIILARYMQILTPTFVAENPYRIINIHHSFLPAFIGAKPYERAYKRGVKLIGATSHYVTDDLDEGPIIEQDIERVNHRDDAEELKKKGRLIERTVLARAVKWHLEDRILVYGNRTIVFN
ncbi:formyltetrahydrofolate deformylase [Priestia flexa]|jgi:formyltetrahydrofolate deformylase|uniref:Formyltetrahydrofolate deformylase n=2 Tax=Priestia TaxID=2800373 RepID=A0A0V8JPX1_9BACI|nr:MULTISPECIES: formyltetrahydrofolate deformylase [Bacillaceae]AQX54216.1 formyltetrahydrofolate deformylase [Priestia flexa]KSU88988.1 formyltetrahydrofolate deformylase [Priestia veravalensis]KZB91516.1 formyltetrahydrofolate deformylase [Bacillus sp. VT 712]MBN8251668.1 formyltetrahydrofolate deformylase [Priestia flexa]MBN8434915.1 formyltetrahydrofolate deformylase [Priestia flexa]